MTASTDIDNDPMFDVSDAAMQKARDLQAHLQSLRTWERERQHASDMIRATWKKIEREGHDVRAARSKLVLLAISGD